MRATLATLGCASILALTGVACSRAGSPSDAPADGGSNADAGSKADAEGAGEAAALDEAELVGRELPGELLAELRKQGDDADGRLLTLAPGFMATAACSDCGAPSYLWFLAVRCEDERHCEVLTEVCEGSIAREGERYALDFHAVEGAAEGSAEICASYTGSFEAP